eukprot:g3974.t1
MNAKSAVGSSAGGGTATAASISTAAGSTKATNSPKKALAEYFCPLSGQPIQDTMQMDDGFTYERLAVTDWYNAGLPSPITGYSFSNKAKPNLSLESKIQAWQSSRETAVARPAWQSSRETAVARPPEEELRQVMMQISAAVNSLRHQTRGFIEILAKGGKTKYKDHALNNTYSNLRVLIAKAEALRAILQTQAKDIAPAPATAPVSTMLE